MGKLNIDFQEGFAGELVVVKLDGREVHRQDKVQTKRAIGYAASQQVQTPPGEHTVEIILPDRDLSTKVKLPAADETHLGFSVEGGKISHIISTESFGYG